MGAIDNVFSGEDRAQAQRQARSERAAPIGFSTISRGSLQILSPEGLIVKGSMRVDGQCVGSGAWTWTGTTTLNGPVNIAGTQTVTGVLNVNGPWNLAGTGGITGAVACTGNWTWTGQLLVNAGGKIVIAGSPNMSIGPLGSGIGGITWGTTFPSLYSDGSSVAIGSGSTVYVTAGSAGCATVYGSKSIGVDATSHIMANPLTSGLAANVYTDPATGRIYRSTSALRYKKNIRTIKHDPRLLHKVSVVLFDDRDTEHKDIPGVIAEVVAKNGGEPYVRRGPDGKIETVLYERLALARTAILASENTDLRAQNVELRRDLDDLRKQVAELATIVKAA
jgi:hypothetical protein